VNVERKTVFFKKKKIVGSFQIQSCECLGEKSSSKKEKEQKNNEKKEKNRDHEIQLQFEILKK